VAALSGDAADWGQGRSVVVFDYDNDGDQDIFIANNCVPEGVGAPPEPYDYKPARAVLLRNDTANTNRYLEVRLQGAEAPHLSHGIGARVYLLAGGREQMRELHASSGFLGHGPGRVAHFGVGDLPVVERVRAVWTNGDETEWREVSADQTVILSSPLASVSNREMMPGESVTATFPVDRLPEGASVSWWFEGVEFGNPATVVLSDTGRHALTAIVTASGESGDPPFLWSETLRVTVHVTEVDERGIAQIWNEQNLDAIRIDFPDPTVHARQPLCHFRGDVGRVGRLRSAAGWLAARRSGVCDRHRLGAS
jgi:hypothetical protein